MGLYKQASAQIANQNTLSDYVLADKYMKARERNRNRVLLDMGIDDPTTAQRRAMWGTLWTTLKHTGHGAAIGGALGGVAGVAGDGVAGAGSGIAIGAVAGAGAYLLASAIGSIGNHIRGSVLPINSAMVEKYYKGELPYNVDNNAFATAQLDKLVQDRQSRYQQEAPTQLA